MKTRLVKGVITQEDALVLHEAFMKDTFHQAAKSSAMRIFFSLTDTDPVSFDSLLEVPFFQADPFRDNKLSNEFHIQPAGTFGRKMKDAIDWFFKNSRTEKMVVLGVDSPQLQPEVIDRSLELLSSHDCVLGPSAAGGIYLIGLCRKTDLTGFENVFDDVELMSFTDYLEEKQMTYAILPELVDIDTEEDLVSLIAWMYAVDRQNRGVGPQKISQAKYTLEVVNELGLSITVQSGDNRNKHISRK